MREIKFRGISHKTHSFVYGFFATANRAPIIIFSDICHHGDHQEVSFDFIKPGTKGQFTGLTDSKGVEIYEGDILKVSQYIGGNFIDEMIRNKKVLWGRFGWSLHPANITLSHPQSLYFNDDESAEVIGNIHENPELLEATK